LSTFVHGVVSPVLELQEHWRALVAHNLEQWPYSANTPKSLSPRCARVSSCLRQPMTRGPPQNLPPGTTDVVVDADAVGPGLTVRVRLPDDSTQIAYVTFDQLAVYESGR